MLKTEIDRSEFWYLSEDKFSGSTDGNGLTVSGFTQNFDYYSHDAPNYHIVFRHLPEGQLPYNAFQAALKLAKIPEDSLSNKLRSPI